MFAKQEYRLNKTSAPASSPTGNIECRACLKKFSAKLTHYNIHQLWPALGANKPKMGLDGVEGTIAKDLAKICNIQLMESDKHSKLICSVCCSQLYYTIKFISTVQKNDEILKQRNLFIEVPFNYNDKIWPKPIQVDKNINGALGQCIEIKEEILSDDDYGYNETGANDAGMDIKIEPEEVLPIKITVNGTISQDQMNKQVSINGCEVFENVERLDTEVKQEPTSEDEDQILSDLPLECLLCAKPFNSISGLKAHVIAQHSYKSVKRKSSSSPSPQKKRNDKYICATCRRSFVTSTDLMVHETCHNKSVCYGCNDMFDTFELLSQHRRRCKAIRDKDHPKHKTLEDVIRQIPEECKVKKPKQTLKCSLCTEEFSEAYYMKIHHEIHHSDEKTGISDLDSVPSATGESTRSEENIDVKARIKETDKMEKELESTFEKSTKNEDKHKDTENQNTAQSKDAGRVQKNGNETDKQQQICRIKSVEQVVDMAESVESMLAHCETTGNVSQKQESGQAEPVEKMETDQESILEQPANVAEREPEKMSEVTEVNDNIEVDLKTIFSQSVVLSESGTSQISEQVDEVLQQSEQRTDQSITEDKMEIDCPEKLLLQTDNVKTSEPVQETELLQKSKLVQEIEPVQENEPFQENEAVLESEPVQESKPVQESNLVQESDTVQKSETVQESEPLPSCEPVRESDLAQESSPVRECEISQEIETVLESEPVLRSEEPSQKSEQNVMIEIKTNVEVENNKIEEILAQTETISAQESEQESRFQESEHDIECQESELKEEPQPLQESELVLTEKELEIGTIKALESFKEK